MNNDFPPVAASHALIDKAIKQYKPIAVYGLFSGGHDSLTATHIAAQHPAFTSAVHINTGIGVAQTRTFVRDTCKKYSWKLKEYRAKEDCGQDYREIVLKYGFPGPGVHARMYQRLKERALRLLLRETKVGHRRRDTVLLISGVRSQESQRRMGHVQPIQKEGSKIWVAVIHDWSKIECNHYLDAMNIGRNPVVDAIHKSGECLCGAYAKPGELDELAMWFPETAKEIRDLEADVRAAGHKWGWGEKPPRKPKKKKTAGMMCHSCEKQPG